MPIMEIMPIDGPPTPESQLTLIRVESIMLWPEADVARQEYLDSARIAWAKENMPADFSVRKEDVAWFADTLPLAVVQQRAKPRYLDGCLVGHIICALFDTDEPAHTLTEAKKRGAASYHQMLGGRGWATKPLLKRVDNDIWPRFRPVAHFWAAYITIMRRGGGSVFPCRYDQLAAFLASADDILERGERFRAPHAPTALLDRETAWSVRPCEPALSTGSTLPNF